MANSRDLIINENNSETLVPKRKKRKKKEPRIQALVQGVDFSSKLLDQFIHALTNEETSLILNEQYYNDILKFFDAKDMLSYSEISKRAYVNVHSKPHHRFTLYSEPTQKKLKQINQTFTDIEAETNTAIETTKEMCSGRTTVGFVLASIIIVPLFMPGLILYAHGQKLLDNTTLYKDPKMENKALNEIATAWILLAVLPLTGLFVLLEIARRLKSRLESRLEDNHENMNLFEEMPQAIKNLEDLSTTQNKLILFSQDPKKTENTATEKTALLKKG